MRRELLILLIPLLAACSMQGSASRVQNRYADVQDACRIEAELGVAKSAATLPPEQQGAALVEHFSQCMNKSGWPVTNPLKSKAAKARIETETPPSTAGATVANPPPTSAAVPPDPARYQPRSITVPTPAPEAKPGRQF